MTDDFVHDINDVKDGTKYDVPQNEREQTTLNFIKQHFNQYLVAAAASDAPMGHVLHDLRSIANKIIKERLDSAAIASSVRIRGNDRSTAIVAIVHSKGTTRWKIELNS